MRKTPSPKQELAPVDMTEPDSNSSSAALIRLQRFMASAGIASRRRCEEYIVAGRVTVDGKIVTELGTKVDPQRQVITVDGEVLRSKRHVYYMLNKPPGIVSTSHDESGRLRVIDLVESNERVYTVGRLDKSSEGLILVTNDGDWANQLTHPRYGVPKTYWVRVVGQPANEILDRLRSGIRLAEGMARADSVRVRKQFQHCTDLEIVLREGRNREIRRIMAHVGHKVVLLKRIAIGPIRLGELPSGAYRDLTPAELASVQSALRAKGAAGAAPRSRPHAGARARMGKYSAKSRERWGHREATGGARRDSAIAGKSRPTKKPRRAAGPQVARPSQGRRDARSKVPPKKRGQKPKFGRRKPRP